MCLRITDDTVGLPGKPQVIIPLDLINNGLKERLAQLAQLARLELLVFLARLELLAHLARLELLVHLALLEL